MLDIESISFVDFFCKNWLLNPSKSIFFSTTKTSAICRDCLMICCHHAGGLHVLNGRRTDLVGFLKGVQGRMAIKDKKGKGEMSWTTNHPNVINLLKMKSWRHAAFLVKDARDFYFLLGKNYENLSVLHWYKGSFFRIKVTII